MIHYHLKIRKAFKTCCMHAKKISLQQFLSKSVCNSSRKLKKNAISPAEITARVDENCQCSQVTGITCDCTLLFSFDETLNTCIPSSDSQKYFWRIIFRNFLSKIAFLQWILFESMQEWYFKMFHRWWVSRKCELFQKRLYWGRFSSKCKIFYSVEINLNRRFVDRSPSRGGSWIPDQSMYWKPSLDKLLQMQWWLWG